MNQFTIRGPLSPERGHHALEQRTPRPVEAKKNHPVGIDRRAITFRTLAVAAIIVLTIAPEALVHPSFQMSFAATLGLVALVQIGMPNLFAAPDHSATARVALWGGREFTMLLLASLVAGLATTPYAAFHFHRVTPYGVLANLAAMPVVSALVMPAGLLGLARDAIRFRRLVLGIMGAGIDWMIVVTQWVAALPGAVGRMPAFGIGPLIAASAASSCSDCCARRCAGPAPRCCWWRWCGRYGRRSRIS